MYVAALEQTGPTHRCALAINSRPVLGPSEFLLARVDWHRKRGWEDGTGVLWVGGRQSRRQIRHRRGWWNWSSNLAWPDQPYTWDAWIWTLIFTCDYTSRPIGLAGMWRGVQGIKSSYSELCLSVLLTCTWYNVCHRRLGLCPELATLFYINGLPCSM